MGVVYLKPPPGVCTNDAAATPGTLPSRPGALHPCCTPSTVRLLRVHSATDPGLFLLQDFNSVADFPGAHPHMAVSIPQHMPVLSAVGASLRTTCG